MSLVARVARNTFYQIFGKIFSTAAGLVTVGLMTRYLGQTGYGYYTTIVAFMQFFGVLADFGLQMAATHLISRPGADEQKIFNNIFALRFVSALFFLGSAAIIVWFLPYPLIIKQGAALISLSFFFISLQSVLRSIFQKKIEMAQVALAEIWGKIILLGGVWLAIEWQKDLIHLVGVIVISNFIHYLILHRAALKHLRLRFDFDWQIWRQIWHTTWPLAATVALTLVYFRADTIIMSFIRPQNEVGIYGAPYRVLEILIQFPYLFLGLILPLLTNFFIVNRKLFQQTIQKSFDFLMILVVPMIFSTLILGEKIMVFIAGEEFLISGQLIKILMFAVAAIYLGALFGYAIVACGLQKKMIKFYAWDAVISLALYLIFIPLYTYWAAAILTIFTEAVIALAAFYVLRKYVGLSLEFKILNKTIGASLIMALTLVILINQNIITLVLIGLIVYFGALFALRGFSKQTVVDLVKFKN